MSFGDTRLDVLALWNACLVRPECVNIVDEMAAKIMGFKTQYYDPAAAQSGLPWYMIGVIDMREEDFDHGCYLGNGDPLDRVTVDVPRGRGPFASWAAGAADALTMDGFNVSANGHWDIVTVLKKLEQYNGIGYAKRGLPSPYVWALTNQQVAGKYVSDGQWSSSTWDTQPGCAAVLLTLKTNYAVDLQEQ